MSQQVYMHTRTHTHTHTHSEFVESFSQRLDGLHVQVISRLIQDIKVWTEGQREDDISSSSNSRNRRHTKTADAQAPLPWHGHLCEGHPALLSSWQTGHWSCGQLPSDTVTSQLVAVFLLCPTCSTYRQQPITAHHLCAVSYCSSQLLL